MIQNDVIKTAKREGIAEGRDEGRAEGRAEGLAEGRAEEREANLKKLLESARSMLNDGLSPEKVMLYTGLSEKQMKTLL